MSEVKAIGLTDFELKDDGSFVAAFARFNEVDHDRDVTYPGAIPVKNVPISDYGHTSWPQRGGRLPVGKGQIGPDGELALIRGGFFLKTSHGADAYETVKGMGDEQEWSYGFDVVDFEAKPKAFPKARRGLKMLDIHEVSPVLLGAGVTTGTLAIKELDDDLLAGSFTEQADRVLDALKELHLREGEIVELRVKEGRAISSERRKRLEDQLEILRALVGGHESLLAETAPAPKEPAQAPDGKARLAFAQAKLREEMVRRGYSAHI